MKNRLEKGTLGKGTLGKGTLGKGTVGSCEHASIASSRLKIFFIFPVFMSVIMTALISSQSFADESLLLMTTRSDSNEVSNFNLVTSADANLIGLKMDDQTLIKISELTKGVTTQDGYVSIPFRGKRYRKFVILKAVSKISEKDGGLIDIFYITNGLTNNFGKYRVSLERMGSKWQLYTNPNADHRAFNALHFNIGTLGINEVKASMKKMSTFDSEFAFDEL